MKRLNWQVILSNLAEAREELERIETGAKKGEKISEIELQIVLEHAYHHLNFAWNARHVPAKRYTHLTDEEFNLWSKYPKEIEEYRIDSNEKEKERDKKQLKKKRK